LSVNNIILNIWRTNLSIISYLNKITFNGKNEWFIEKMEKKIEANEIGVTQTEVTVVSEWS